MGDVLADAVMSAMTAVRSAMPSLSKTMTAGGVTADVVLASSVDAGTASATTGGVNSTMKLVAQTADFPALELTQGVRLDGSPHMIVGLKLTGGAAWFLDVSRELETVAVKAKSGGRIVEFSASCAIVMDDVYSTSIGGAMHTLSGDVVTVFVPFEEWQGDEKPCFGVRFRFADGRTATAQVVEKMDYAWKCACVRNMRESDR